MISDKNTSVEQTQVRLKGEQESNRESLKLQSRLIEEGCIECGLCSKDCLFLQKYGSPKEIAEQNRATLDFLSSSFECSLCGLCTAVCPAKIDPAAMFFAMRIVAETNGQGVSRQHKGLLAYERHGVSSFFSWYGLPEGCDTVFFPGCAMAGSRSNRILQLYQYLQQTIPALGMVVDCCSKPSHDLARQEYFHRMFGAMREALQQKGVRRILVACPSCYRVWKEHGGAIKVETVYELLSRDGPAATIESPETVTVHDPCPTRNDIAIHNGVRSLITAMGFRVQEMKHHGRKTLCCGEGGAACYVAPDFAGNWTRTRASEAGETLIITYCAGCTHFLGRLSQVVHLVDLFFEPEKTLAGRIKVARSPLTWLHRIALKRRLQRLVRSTVSGQRGAGGEILFRKCSKPAGRSRSAAGN